MTITDGRFRSLRALFISPTSLAGKFDLGDDADDVGEFGETSAVAGGEYFPVLQVSDASLDCGPYSGDQLLLSFVSGSNSPFLDFLSGVIAVLPR